MTDFQTYVVATRSRQSDLAKRLGISQPHLSQILASKRKPSLELAVRIEKLTGGAVPAGSWVEDGVPAVGAINIVPPEAPDSGAASAAPEMNGPGESRG